jgi:cytochrome c oxidase subunit 4
VEEETAAEQVHVGSYRTYVAVWAALMVLLAATIAVARFDVSRFSVLINLAIATLKASLVLAFFMHLKYEGRFLNGLLFFTLAALASIIALTFSDVWYR